MAYELTCPGCGAVVKSPFVRVGAVVTCGQCSTRYSVREQDIRRPSGGAAAADPAVVLIEDDPPQPNPHDPGGTDVTGLSGLSTLMRQQDRVAAVDVAEALPGARAAAAIQAVTPAAPAPAGGPTSTAAAIATRRRARRRRQQVSLVIGISITAALLLVGLMILIALMPDPKAPPESIDDLPSPPVALTPPDPADPPEPEPGPDPVPAPDPTDLEPDPPPPPTVVGDPPDPAPAPEPRVEAISLLPTDWRRFEPPIFLPPDADDPIRVLAAQIIDRPNGRFAKVTVISDTLSLIDQATLTVALTDEAGQAAMAFAVPVSLLDPLSQRSYEVALPDDAPPELTLAARVKLRHEVPRSHELIGVGVEASPETEGPALRFSARTPEDIRLNEAVFTLTALDEEGTPRGIWRCSVPGPFAGGTTVRALATFPEADAARLPSPSRARWSASAVGLE